MKLDIDKLDFEHCEDEPIHIPESIQSYGYLFALERDNGTIKIISENVRDLLTDYDRILGTNFFELLKDEEDTDFLIETYNRARRKNTRLPLQLNFKEKLTTEGNPSDYYAVVYDSDDHFVIELEPAGKFRQTYSARHFIKLYAMSIAPKFKSFKSLGKMAQEIVDTIKYVTEMERVVLYKFNHDNSGKVIAEAKEDDLDSYLDLYYPATDIPKQARELYKKNWVRLIPNVDLEPSRLIPSSREKGRKPLDMTYSILRTLSPIHRQYIRNQGLKASFSMSLVTHGDLWGMISCHSREACYIPQNLRLECENLSQLFSWHLYAKEEEIYISKKQKIDRAINKMLDKTTPENPIVEVFKYNEKEVLEIMEADGFMFYSEEEIITLGTTPSVSIIKEIYEREKTFGDLKTPIASESIGDKVSDSSKLNGVAGMLLISLVDRKNYFTAWFREEDNHVQKWAGVPNEKRAEGSKKERLTPRSSFKVHEKIIKGKSRKWEEEDVSVAERFNKVFLAHVLETQDRMRQDIVSLEMQSKYKNEFLATLAHELRNPLAPISSGISLLERENDAQVREKVITSMKRQVGHMSTMIDDLMEVSRVTQGKVKLDMENLPLQDVLVNAIETCRNLIDEKHHSLEVHMPEGNLWTHGDRTRLSQIFVNIINNAAKYTDNGGKIVITAQEYSDCISVKVKDNGLGIPPEKIDTIFTMFTQMDSYTHYSDGGLGIGLTLVKRLVEMHNGSIMARSEGSNKGSEFEVLLPFIEEAPEDTKKENNKTIDKPVTEQKILLVDDNEDILDTLKLLFEMEGYEIQVALRSKDAINIFKEFEPDFAIFDIGMPEINGYELCKKLSATPEAENTVFFSQSGWGNKEQIQKAYDSGFDEHFVKPVDFQKIKEAIQKYANR